VFGSASVDGAPAGHFHRIGRELLRGRVGLSWQRETSWSPGCCTFHVGKVAHRERASTVEH
jgi:hypothetical protein